MKNIIILGLVMFAQLSFAKNGLPLKCQAQAKRMASEIVFQGFAETRPVGMESQSYTSSFMNQDNLQQEDYSFIYLRLPTGIRTAVRITFVVQQRTCILTSLKMELDQK